MVNFVDFPTLASILTIYEGSTKVKVDRNLCCCSDWPKKMKQVWCHLQKVGYMRK